ncbi:MAG: indole-3-glycerol phosphate synthase TrpC [Lactobacillales bacterium]|jgi:indole-3-glycerol phosphate synthase|nr:indole-3-glycerol phosphate synthase TrpC [Lactobacillales bacterium]
MSDILEKIANATRGRINQIKTTDFPFEKSLKTPGISFICEVKKASPSKGIIAEDFDYIQIAKDYEEAGASAISVLTEPEFFKGSNDYLYEIARNVNIPIIRKDFVVDEFMIYEAKTLGASAVLLIVALLDDETLKSFLNLAHSLGLSALVETHDALEVERALKAGARIIGVNNRNLRDFKVDLNTSVELRKLVPHDVIFVSESGISTRADIEKLGNVDAVLIGESFMKAQNKKAHLEALR